MVEAGASGSTPDIEVVSACTLDYQESPERRRAFDLVLEHLVHSAREPGGFRWTFQNSPGVERRVRELARNEHRCCPSLTFAISVQGDQVVWRACGSEEAVVATRLDGFLAGGPARSDPMPSEQRQSAS